MTWISGSCSYEAEDRPTGGPTRTLELQVTTALVQMEGAIANLECNGGLLPTNPLELVALSEKIENATEELRWIREQMAKLGARVNRA